MERSAKENHICLALTIWNDLFPCHTFDLSVYTLICEQMPSSSETNPRWSIQVQNLTRVVTVDLFLITRKKLIYMSSMVKCVQIFLLKKPQIWKGGLLLYIIYFPILVTPRAHTISYLKCITSQEFRLWLPGTHVSSPGTWHTILKSARWRSLNRTCTNGPYPHPEQYFFVLNHSLI